MAGLRFEWNSRKDSLNRRKHGVSFEEASTAFADEHALVIDDSEHSDKEVRFVLLGLIGIPQRTRAKTGSRH